MAIATPSTHAPFSHPWLRGARELPRAELEIIIGGLIDIIDRMDGDADDEPALGSIDTTSHSDFMDQEDWSIGDEQDREAGDDNGLADEDGMIWATQPTRRAA